MTTTFSVDTKKAQQFLDIKALVRTIVVESRVTDGLCCIYCPHLTAGITIAKSLDGDIVWDMLLGLDKAFPNSPEFHNFEKNSSAYLKAIAVGASVTVPIENGMLVLDKWQAITLCEFEGPKTRTVKVTIVKA